MSSSAVLLNLWLQGALKNIQKPGPKQIRAESPGAPRAARVESRPSGGTMRARRSTPGFRRPRQAGPGGRGARGPGTRAPGDPGPRAGEASRRFVRGRHRCPAGRAWPGLAARRREGPAAAPAPPPAAPPPPAPPGPPRAAARGRTEGNGRQRSSRGCHHGCGRRAGGRPNRSSRRTRAG